MKKIKKFFNTAKKRWKAKTPMLFKRVMKFGVSVSTVVLAVQIAFETSHANIPDWWTTVYPYLIGIPAGMAAVSKFTREYDHEGKPIEEEHKNPPPCK